jgi:flagellar biosynthetic protein FliQ
MESDYRLSGEKLLYLTNMTPETVVTIGQQAVEMTLMISAPLAVGLIVSIFQAATQINEMTLSFIPKLLGIFVVLIFTGPWMVNTMVDYIQRLFSNIPWMIG